MSALTIGAGVAGAATSLLSAFLGAQQSKKANDRANSLIQQQEDNNQRWYNMKMNQDYTSRTDAQNIITKQRELLNEQYKNARGAQAVVGGSDEALAEAKAAANNSLSETMSNMGAQAASYKDQVEQQYLQNKNALNQQKVGIAQQQAQNIATAAGQGVTAGLGLVGSVLDKVKA